MSGSSQIKSGVTWHIQDIMYPRTSQFLPPSTTLASCGCERLRCTLLACRGCCCRRWATKVFSCGKSTQNEKHQEHLHERLISKRNVGKYTSPIHWSNQIITTKQPEKWFANLANQWILSVMKHSSKPPRAWRAVVPVGSDSTKLFLFCSGKIGKKKWKT